jgi:hypothetical protein
VTSAVKTRRAEQPFRLVLARRLHVRHGQDAEDRIKVQALRQAAKRLEHLSAVSQCCGRSASRMTYPTSSEEWLQQDLVEGFRWAELSVFRLVERPGRSWP